MDISVFAARLTELRKNQGLTQYELHKKTGIGKTSIENYENCRTIPSSEAIYTFCKFFKCTSDYLIGLTDNSALSPTAMEGAQLINSMKRAEQEWIIFIIEAITTHIISYRRVQGKLKSHDFMTKLFKEE